MLFIFCRNAIAQSFRLPVSTSALLLVGACKMCL